MNIIPVIFEDHRLARFRPLAWSTPVFELRCGMFNTRERVGLCNPGGGVLLGRTMLQGLHNAQAWDWGAGAIAKRGGPDTMFLFINGLLAPDFSLVEKLFFLAGASTPFVWHDDDGLVAALMDGEQARDLAADWNAWESRNDGKGVWSDPGSVPEDWSPEIAMPDEHVPFVNEGHTFRYGEEVVSISLLGDLAEAQVEGFQWIWGIVDSVGRAIRGDVAFVAPGNSFRREPFGIFVPQSKEKLDWTLETTLRTIDQEFTPEQASRWDIAAPEKVFCAEGVQIAAGTAFDTSSGPVILDRGVRIMPHCYLEGPLYIGPGSLVKPGARLHGDSSFGIVNRIAGEVGESTFGDFANKQHAGFIGHAVLGAWINLGALTTCSDLKNNYGEIRVDLGSGPVATGSRFVGLMMGDHAKSAIGTMFNTGTSVGFATNIFGGEMPPKFVGNFQWGGQAGCPRYAVDRACSTSSTVMARRGCVFTSAHEDLFRKLGG